MEPLVASEGWGVLHLFYRVDPERAVLDGGRTAKRLLAAIETMERDDHQVLTFAVLGHKADLGIMVLGPDLTRLQAFQAELRDPVLQPLDSYVSMTELSEYSSTETDERARLEREDGVVGAAADERLVAWRERMQHYAENRVHPRLPRKRSICFYPMSKRRNPSQNWFALPFDERKQLMGGHARTGRTYAGRVLQLITGSVGLDDWEWGVTLLADDPKQIKSIVYEMRFDEVSAQFAEFGPFWFGLLGDPAEVLERVGLRA